MQVGTRKRPAVEPGNREERAAMRLRAVRARWSEGSELSVPTAFHAPRLCWRDEQLPGTGDERAFVLLSGREQSPVESNELWIPAHRGRQGSAIERPAQSFATTSDMTDTDVPAAVVVVGGKASQCGGLLAGDTADLRQAHHNGDGGRQPNAIDALDQSEPFGQIPVLADRCHEGFELVVAALSEASDLLAPGLTDTRITAGLKTVLEAGNIFPDLIDHRQLLGKRRQARIGRSVDRLDRCGAGRDQSGIDLVILGSLQAKLRI